MISIGSLERIVLIPRQIYSHIKLNSEKITSSDLSHEDYYWSDFFCCGTTSPGESHRMDGKLFMRYWIWFSKFR